MGRTYTDFSQLSKGMFRKSEPVEEIKPIRMEAYKIYKSRQSSTKR